MTSEEMEAEISNLNADVARLASRTEDIDRWASCVENVLRCGQDVGSVFTFGADGGTANAVQSDLAALMIADAPVGAFFGGDNNYPSGDSATINAAWAAFDALITQQIVYPAMGNHDLDTLNGQPQVDKFTYLPGNGRYYSVYFEESGVEWFVLNSGINTAGSVVEVDGNHIGSDQYKWFINAVQASKARWKFGVIHHPPFSQSTKHDLVLGGWNTQWNFNGILDALFCGHMHSNEHIAVSSDYNHGKPLHVIQCSTLSDIKATPAFSPNINAGVVSVPVIDGGYNYLGANPELVWKDVDAAVDTVTNVNNCYVRVTAYLHRVTIEFVNALGNVIYGFEINRH